jgi:glycosyltransferase involved in cell wall biosynthesis
MNCGGVETWLMHVLRRIDRRRIAMDFLVQTDRPCVYDEEIRGLGSRILHCTPVHRPWRFMPELARILRHQGPFHVVHSHVHHFSGLILKCAHRCGVPIRIAHSHSDTRFVENGARLLRRGYLRLAESWIHRHATTRLACSRKAGAALFGPKWEEDPAARLLYCGIDLAPFRRAWDRAAARAQWGIPEDALVLGHVGRLEPPKNHAFLLEIAAEVARRRPSMRLLLVGDGQLRPQIEAKARQLGLAEKVIFAGWCGDVADVLGGAMDVFVFPSLYEGLPLSCVEAQAAGLPTFISDAVTGEVGAIDDLVTWLSSQASAAVWAEAILQRPPRSAVDQRQALSLLSAGPFAIENCLPLLEGLYYREPATPIRRAA